jgi:hypothetical protein
VASTGKLDERSECSARFHSRPGKSREEAHGELWSNSPVSKAKPCDQVWKPAHRSNLSLRQVAASPFGLLEKT